MFLGRFEHALDTKFRLALPSRFRARLAEGFVVTAGIDRCLVVHPMQNWAMFAAEIDALPDTDSNVRTYRRMVFGEAVDIVLDGQGRFVVPPALRSWAAIDREAIVVGVHASIEIWSPDGWAAASTSFDADRSAVADAVGDLLRRPRPVN